MHRSYKLRLSVLGYTRLCPIFGGGVGIGERSLVCCAEFWGVLDMDGWGGEELGKKHDVTM